ncbi:TetR/AcrR family transcriptional regulator C-terminal domain-containing protein [Sphaerisporangium aureirubrum]|uniref:TetR/AcrR family transcriptional regulator C-terminal domain-containing protein n=1 Tax=Sphaerisporangium aureirubrum TaxID=1544736 RepID=A0ABW1NUE7_9ACTN
MPRPRSLTHTALATAALAVIDRDGLGALSMRAVATELGMATMSLYRYVTDRHQLEGLVVELVLAEVDITPPPGLPWQAQVTALVDRVRAAVGAHPEVVPLTMTHRHTSLSLHRWTEAVLTVLTAAGFTGRPRVLALRAVLAHTVGSLQMQHLGSLAGPGTAVMTALSPDDYPLLAETARTARPIPPDEEFHHGLAALLTGLAR